MSEKECKRCAADVEVSALVESDVVVAERELCLTCAINDARAQQSAVVCEMMVLAPAPGKSGEQYVMVSRSVVLSWIKRLSGGRLPGGDA